MNLEERESLTAAECVVEAALAVDALTHGTDGDNLVASAYRRELDGRLEQLHEAVKVYYKVRTTG